MTFFIPRRKQFKDLKPDRRRELNFSNEFADSVILASSIIDDTIIDYSGFNWGSDGSPEFNYVEGTNGILSSTANNYITSDPRVRDLPETDEFSLIFRAHAPDAVSDGAILGWSGDDDLVAYPASTLANSGFRVFWRDAGGSNIFDTVSRVGKLCWYIYTFQKVGSNIFIDGYVDGVLVDSYTAAASAVGPFTNFQLGSWETQQHLGAVLSDCFLLDRFLDGDAAKSFSEHPYQILKPIKTYSILGGSVAANNLTSTAKSTTKTSAQINASVPIVGASASSSIGNAAISASLPLNIITASISDANGQLSANISITASALSQSLANVNLNLSALMQAQVQANASGNGVLGVDVGNTDLTANSKSSADANAVLSLSATLSGTIISKALGQANISTGQELTAQTKSSASGSGFLLLDVPVIGQAKSYVKGLGGLSAIVPIRSSSASASNATGGLNVSANLSATALANALVQAGLNTTSIISLSASMKSVSRVTVDVGLEIALSSNIKTNSNLIGNLSLFSGIDINTYWVTVIDINHDIILEDIQTIIIN